MDQGLPVTLFLSDPTDHKNVVVVVLNVLMQTAERIELFFEFLLFSKFFYLSKDPRKLEKHTCLFIVRRALNGRIDGSMLFTCHKFG